jgi:polyphosphate glucokinase
MTKVLGIDFGGSGVKGALIDVATGQMMGDRHRIPTPQPATPEGILDTVEAIRKHFCYKGPIGMGFPGVIQNGISKTASNIDKAWVDYTLADNYSAQTKHPFFALNDADAAAMAELRFGTTMTARGTAIFLTIGTGIGSAIIRDGQLLPNTELGHLRFMDSIAEKYASDAVRKKKDLGWKCWGDRFSELLAHLERLFWPDIFVLGGGISKKFDKYEMFLSAKAEIKPASLKNEAGIIGAAIFAHEQFSQ